MGADAGSQPPQGGILPSAAAGGAQLPAREAALRLLSDLRVGRQTAKLSFDALVRRHPVRPRDVSLTHELVLGVVRHQLTLSCVLGAFTRARWDRINQRLQHILMLAAYQLIWLDGIPEFAAVNEAVEQARAEGGRRTGSFVNAVLRQLLRQIEQRRIPTEQADPVRSVMVDERQSCQFRVPVLPDPEEEPLQHTSCATSCPSWLLSRWGKTFGFEQASAIARTGAFRPPITLRPNSLRIDAPGLRTVLAAQDFAAQVTPEGQAVVLRQAAGLFDSPAFKAGLFQPQDRTSMQVVQRMGLAAGQAVIDLCAGLGTKTTQMAELMNDEGAVLASDKDESKLSAVDESAERLGHRIIRSAPPGQVEAEAHKLPRLDWIMIDAPCSNTGVLARRPEARYRIRRRSLQSLSGIQTELLETAASLARPRTRLLYSTCSLEPEENEQVVQAFCRSHPAWAVMDSRLTFPQAGAEWWDWRDGGYWAVLAAKDAES